MGQLKKILTRKELISILRKEQPFLKSHFGVKKMAIFGSFAKGTQTVRSDIDMIVAFKKPAVDHFFGLIDYLEKKFGREVEVLTPIGVKSIRVKRIAQDIKRSLVNV